MAQSFKICPICKTLNHSNAMVCTTCGTSLGEVTAVNRLPSAVSQSPYDFKYGENDLMESSASKGARAGLFILGVASLITIGLIVGVIIASLPPTDDSSGVLVVTETPHPTLDFATVTLGPPTPTGTPTPTLTYTPGPTETPAPCVQTIVAGGSLIAAILNCGYNNLDIMPTVMAFNNITDPASLQLGQQIIIPYPSPTIDPDAVPVIPDESQSANVSVAMSNPNDLFAVDTSIDAFAPTATATLPPGVMWHNVAPGDNVITIAVAYNADAKTLSELNPEIDFARCEFGERFGGPQCLVQLRAGQILRVPAPTPMPTASPTPDPNATATPTPTATFNQPNIVSPPDRQFFGTNDLVTLRWSPSATLQSGQQYIVNILDRSTGTAYQATTTDITFLVPQEWRGTVELRHEYEWTIGILDTATNRVTLQTTPRLFVWQGRPENRP